MNDWEQKTSIVHYYSRQYHKKQTHCNVNSILVWPNFMWQIPNTYTLQSAFNQALHFNFLKCDLIYMNLMETVYRGQPYLVAIFITSTRSSSSSRCPSLFLRYSTARPLLSPVDDQSRRYCVAF